jgi:hypothetical protein
VVINYGLSFLLLLFKIISKWQLLFWKGKSVLNHFNRKTTRIRHCHARVCAGRHLCIPIRSDSKCIHTCIHMYTKCIHMYTKCIHMYTKCIHMYTNKVRFKNISLTKLYKVYVGTKGAILNCPNVCFPTPRKLNRI